MSEARGTDGLVTVLDCPQPEAASLGFGGTSAAAGIASLAFARAAIKAALAGEADAVVAAPQNETSIARAGIAFDGYPSFVARETGTNTDDVYLMLCFGATKIAHATLHRSVRDALALITREKVAGVIEATARALARLGIASPAIAVGGLNPHAGEGGLFGREEIDIISAGDRGCRRAWHQGQRPVRRRYHVSYARHRRLRRHAARPGAHHRQALAPNATAAMTIGTPILFSSVAHGSAHDIAGKGIASPNAMIDAILRLAKR